MLSDEDRIDSDEEWRVALVKQTKTSFFWLKGNTAADFVIRCGLYLGAGVILGKLISYLFGHADPMARQLLGTTPDNPNEWWTRAGSVTYPIGLMLTVATLCVLLSLHVQTRSNRDFENGQEGVSRLRRDSVGVPRARALTQILEETVANARRAFRLQLWLSRSLFVFGLAFLVSFLGYTLVKNDVTLVSTILGIGSIGSVVSAAVVKPGSTVAGYLGDITQLELIAITSMRQISLLEEHVFQIMEVSRESPADVEANVQGIVSQMSSICETALKQIQKFTEPKVEASSGSKSRAPGA